MRPRSTTRITHTTPTVSPRAFVGRPNEPTWTAASHGTMKMKARASQYASARSLTQRSQRADAFVVASSARVGRLIGRHPGLERRAPTSSS